MATLEPEVDEVPAVQGALHLDGVDAVEPHVGGACPAARFDRGMFGFRPVAQAGLMTGVRDRLSIVKEQGDDRPVLTGGLDPHSPIARRAALNV